MSKFGKAVWASGPDAFGDNSEELAVSIGKLAEAGFDLVFPCVKYGEGGAVKFRSKLRPMTPATEKWDPLAVLTEQCKKAGIKVHPWICVFNEGKGSAFLAEHPELQAIDPDGKPLDWACPTSDEVQEHLRALYTEAMDNYDVAGVHLDYIRYEGENMCFCERCRETFTRRYKEDALEIHKGGWGEHFWMDFREENIRRFVRSMRKLTADRGKELSAATWSSYLYAKRGYGQDWPAWTREGLLDLSCPMDYTDSVEELEKAVSGQIAAVEGKCPLWIGIGKKSSMSELTPQQFGQQVQLCKQLGADGITVFQYSALTDEDLEILKSVP